jgi:Mn-dependent DtxR family transcriptional regulator
MSTETIELSVLRAMLRLSRRRQPADVEAIAERVGAPARAIRAALRRLAHDGFVDRPGEMPPRLTLVGFAVAVASLPPATRIPRPNPQRSSRAA